MTTNKYNGFTNYITWYTCTILIAEGVDACDLSLISAGENPDREEVVDTLKYWIWWMFDDTANNITREFASYAFDCINFEECAEYLALVVSELESGRG